MKSPYAWPPDGFRLLLIFEYCTKKVFRFTISKKYTKPIILFGQSSVPGSHRKIKTGQWKNLEGRRRQWGSTSQQQWSTKGVWAFVGQTEEGETNDLWDHVLNQIGGSGRILAPILKGPVRHFHNGSNSQITEKVICKTRDSNAFPRGGTLLLKKAAERPNYYQKNTTARHYCNRISHRNRWGSIETREKSGSEILWYKKT